MLEFANGKGIIELSWKGSEIYVAIDCLEDENIEGKADIKILVDRITKAVQTTNLNFPVNEKHIARLAISVDDDSKTLAVRLNMKRGAQIAKEVNANYSHS
ncbi:hypothetical protein MAR_005655 [Mya arenaria]|uniref:Uncharacterized protein n=1 Tax=Mya arenaria TaxID=6604 RepID=A0ABY7F1K6_MYAAR|nr:hypothetical protein MAR_005655 [Mya arenaria]